MLEVSVTQKDTLAVTSFSDWSLTDSRSPLFLSRMATTELQHRAISHEKPVLAHANEGGEWHKIEI